MKNTIKLLVVCFGLMILLAGSVYAASDVAYVVKNTADPSIVSALNQLNYSYDVIKDTEIAATNFSNYALIVAQGNLNNKDKLPLKNVSSIFLESNIIPYVWDGVQVGTTSTKTARLEQLGTKFTEGISNVDLNIYTSSQQVYYLNVKPASVKRVMYLNGASTYGKSVIAYTDDTKVRTVYFGLPNTDYWTSDSQILFKNSLAWIREGIDKDKDGFFANDCNDLDANVHPGAQEIPYDGIDQDCNGFDFADKDGDGYDSELVGGLDCNDDDPLMNPSSNDSLLNCINEAPEFSGVIPVASWNEEGSYTLDIASYFSDPDLDNLTYGVHATSTQQGISLNMTGSVVRFTSEENWYGNDWIIFKAEDSGGLYSTTNTVQLIVFPVNDNPSLSPIEDITVLAGRNVQIIPNATDVDGDDLIFSFESPLNSNGTWQTSENDFGTYRVRVIVDDGNNGIDSQIVDIFVVQKVVINELYAHAGENESDWVEIYNPYDQTFRLDECTLFDGVNNTLELSGLIGKEGFKVFEWSNRLNNDGDSVELYCYDELLDKVVYGNWDDGNLEDNVPMAEEGKSIGRNIDGLDTNTKEDFKIYDIPTKEISNNADMISPEVVLIRPENGTLFNERNVYVVFNSSDNSDELECSVYINGIFKEKKTEEVGEGNFTITDLPDGLYEWNVDCKDSRNNKTSESRYFEISAPDAPILNFIGTKTVKENETIEFSISATDPDGESINYSVEGVPEGALFLNQTFSWTPNYEQAGSYSVKFIVEDETGLKDFENVVIVVTNVKQPPRFSDIDKCESTNSGVKITIKDPDKGDEFAMDGTIEGKVRVENNVDEDLKFNVRVYLYDVDKEEVIEDEKETLKVDKGKSEDAEFSLNIPSDADSDNEIYLYVKAEDGSYCNSQFVEIKLEREEHSLDIDSVDVYKEDVSPGGLLKITTRIFNLGSEEEDATLELSIPELNITKKVNFEIEEYGEDDSHREVFDIELPLYAEEGNYEFVLKLSYSGETEEERGSFEIVQEMTRVEGKQVVRNDELLESSVIKAYANKRVVYDKEFKLPSIKADASIINMALVIGIGIIFILIILVVFSRRR